MTASLKGLERWGRRSAAVLLSRGIPGMKGPLPEDPGGILVIRTDSRLGNLVLLEPLLRSLGKRFPRARLEVLASDVFADVLKSQGYSVISVDKKGQIRDPSRFVQLLRRLRESHYDVAIDAAHPHSFSLSGAVSACLAGAGCRVSTNAGGSSGWYSVTVPEPPMDWHESRALHSLGSLWKAWPEWSPPAFTAGSRRVRDAVGIHVGATGNKKYPSGKMAELVEELYRTSMIEVYWGSEEERDAAMDLGRRFPVAVMPKMGLTRLMEKLAGLRLFVTADNGPMHLASALAVPVVALFRIDNRNRFAPLSPGSEALFSPEGPSPSLVAGRVLRALGHY